MTTPKPSSLQHGRNFWKLKTRKIRPGSRGWRSPDEVQVRSPPAKNWFFHFYSKFRGSPGTCEAKMQAAASVSKVQGVGGNLKIRVSLLKMNTPKPNSLRHGWNFWKLKIRRTRPGSRGRWSPDEVQVRSPQPKTHFSLFLFFLQQI